VANTYFFGLLAEIQIAAGERDQALESLERAIELQVAQGSRFWDAEVLRLRGELALQDGDRDPRAAEPYLMHALDLARRQGSLALTLRAALSLARLMDGSGRRAEGRRLLSDLYGEFAEGFDTRDLREARAFLTRGGNPD
jgi:adenylate cyclase